MCPAGDTPSSARLFDAIVSGCIPVIVSDELELPFEGILDYKKVYVKERKNYYIGIHNFLGSHLIIYLFLSGGSDCFF